MEHLELFQNLKPVLKEAVEEIEKKAPYAAALASEKQGQRIRVSTKQQSVTPEEPARGLVLTAFNGKYFIEYAVSDLSHESIRSATKGMIELLDRKGIHESEVKINAGEALEKDFFTTSEIDASSISLESKIERMSEYKDLMHSMDERIVNAVAMYGEYRKLDLFVNSKKTLLQDIKRAESIFFFVMNEEGKNAQIHGGRGAHGGWENSYLSEDFIRSHVEDCAKLLTAKRLESGTYECVFDPSFAGLFAHEAFGHGTETDLFLKGRSKGQEFMGDYVASRLVNMYDSPALKGQAGSYFFDDEGQISESTQIIKEGKLISGITDLNSASYLDIKRTPNGRRQEYSHKSYARMTNTYFAPGESKSSEIISSVEDGLLLKHATNGMEDPKGWGIQLEGLYAEKIKNGKLTGEVFSPVIVTGYVPDLLTSINMVGDEIDISGLGMCGKGYKEWVKVTDGGPYLKLRARIA